MSTTISQATPTDMRQTWNERATVRCKPRRLLALENSNKHFYPMTRQPLAIHPLVTDRGEAAVAYILTQTAYRYMYEIATLETEVVNRITLKIANNLLPFEFTDIIRHEALAIIIDEAYHAYVAFDFIHQVKTATGIEPINLPKDNSVSRSLSKFKASLIPAHYSIIELVSICLSENVLTKDLVYLKEETETHPFFIHAMQDHLLDEGRHASYFVQLLKYVWANLSNELHSVVATFLPEFIDDYVDPDANKMFDRQILASMHFDETIINEIIEDTYYGVEQNNSVIVSNFLTVLKHAGILNHPSVKAAFKNRHYFTQFFTSE